jgi:transposase
MSYSEDHRHQVLKYVNGGGSRTAAAELFGVNRKTVYNWLNNKTQAKRGFQPRQRKLVKATVLKLVKQKNDARLIDYANQLGVTHQAVWHALRRWGITKKNDPLCGKDVYKTD